MELLLFFAARLFVTCSTEEEDQQTSITVLVMKTPEIKSVHIVGGATRYD